MIGQRKKIYFLFSAILLAGIFFMAGSAPAQATSTVMGTAYWPTEGGYLSFNCANDVMGDRLDSSYNLCGGYNPTDYHLCAPYTPSNAFHFYSAPCSSSNHAVYIDNNGNFSGQAWNNNEGLVNFQAASTPDSYAFAANCPTATCTSANNCSACYNETTQQVYGWAQVAGDGTWIKLNSTPTATTTPVQIKSWNLASSTSPYYSLNPGFFIGDATTPTLGNISFNCLSEWNGSSHGTCGTRSYQVYISNLQVGHLSAPNFGGSAQVCGSNVLQANLQWNIKSGTVLATSTQAGYEVVVNTASSFSTSTSNYVCWSGHKTGVATSYALPNNDPTCGPLNYNTSYYWWVRLYDAAGNVTPWYQFGTADGHNGLADTHTNGVSPSGQDASATVFTTYKHEFPDPYFTYSPTPVMVGTSTNFTSIPNSVYYTNASPSSTPASCSSFAGCHYSWSTTDGLAIISSPTLATTSITFGQATNTTVTLQLSDPDSYVCSTSTTIGVNYSLPIWREIKAQ